MKIDLHVHTSDRSPCAKDNEIAQIEAAIASGLDAIFITDHWKLVPPRHLEDLNRRFAPFRIFGGIEIQIKYEDLLVLGVPDPILEQEKFEYPALREFVHQRGGFLVLAHPFRYTSTINLPIDTFPPDAIELFSHNTPVSADSKIRAIAQRNRVALLSNSDAHIRQNFGLFSNILFDGAHDEQAVFQQLRSGAYTMYRKKVPCMEGMQGLIGYH